MRDWDRREWLIFLAVVAVGLFLLVAILKSASTSAADPAPVPFDHNKYCQYPDRSTNPVDGCDNSDPCDPANVKGGGSGACTTSTPSQQVQDIPMSQNTKTGDKPVETVHKCE